MAVVLVAGSSVAGNWLTRKGVALYLDTAWPLRGVWNPRLSAGVVLAAGVAALAVWQGPRLAAALPWRRLLVLSYLAAGGWAVSLALDDGFDGLTRPLRDKSEYLNDVPRVSNLGDFLATFTLHVADNAHGPQWTTHVAGHPPGALGLFVLLDRIGLGGAGAAAAVCIGVGAFAVPAVLMTVRVMDSEALARSAAPFVVFAPAALWVATSADALFAGVGAAGICALAHAAKRYDICGDVLAALGGLALGCCLFLSYGLLLLGPLALAVVLVRRRIRPLVIGGVMVAALLGAAALAGFHYVEGFLVAGERVQEGVAWRDRPWAYFAFANIAAVALAAGPATVAALPLWCHRFRTSWRGYAVLPAAVVLVILLALLSNLSKGEVERIYLPFVVWLLPLGALLPGQVRRGWLAAQAGAAVVLAGLLWLWW